MNRNALYIIIGILAVGAVVLSIRLYQEQQEPDGIEIKIGENGISVDER